MTTYATYNIREEHTQNFIAMNLTQEEVAIWWNIRGNEYFGVKIEENDIVVAPITWCLRD